MKLIIAGGRTFNDYKKLEYICDIFLKNEQDIEIVSGTANGADLLGERYAHERNLNVKRFPADCGKFGKSAGFKRNSEMAEYADALIAFWDGNSKGTKHMIDIAKGKGLRVTVISYSNLPKLIEVEIESPIEKFKIGDDYEFSGLYVNGFQSGKSKIKRFYKDAFVNDDGVISTLGVESVFMELENSKLILLGFFNKDGFQISEWLKI